MLFRSLFDSAKDSLTLLQSFSRDQGLWWPIGSLLSIGDDNFLGTLYWSQGLITSCCGAVYRYNLAWNQIVDIVQFPGDESVGSFPVSGLVPGLLGAYYGVTSSGGAYGAGTIYSFTPSSTMPTSVPGPLPVFATVAAFGTSRRLRLRLRGRRPVQPRGSTEV